MTARLRVSATEDEKAIARRPHQAPPTRDTGPRVNDKIRVPQIRLIDHEGEVILRDGLERFADLVVVVGKEAPVHAAALLKTLGNEPELLPLVEAAVWVGGRRWNIRLAGDIDVRLPEKNAKSAWTRLAEYERAHRVLERDVQVLDLRLPDRLIVRKAPKGTPRAKNKGRET